MAILTPVQPSIERRNLRTETAHHYFIPASRQAYRLLHTTFVVAPLLAGLDKFFDLMVDWTVYLSPLATRLTGLSARQFMYGVGVVEVVAAGIVAWKPKIGGLIVCAWLWGIIINLLTIPGFYDIALRDFGLSLCALALSRLSVEFRHYRRAVV
jgi:hypothetical protein